MLLTILYKMRDLLDFILIYLQYLSLYVTGVLDRIYAYAISYYFMLRYYSFIYHYILVF